MSKDFQLAWECPHLTLEEVVALGTDRRTLSIKQPVGNENTVRIIANDEFLLPQGGLLTLAQLASTTSGPYLLQSTTNVLQISASTGTQTFTLPVYSEARFSTGDIIQMLQKNGLQVVMAENVNSHLVLTDPYSVGSDSFVSVSGTAASALGFGDPTQNNYRQYTARGKQLYPGWGIHNRADTITNRYPKFNSPIKANPILKVSYTTVGSRCRRCQNTYIENDYRYDLSGQALLIENENLLYQATMKIILTDQGSNPYYPWYGTTIRSRVGAKAVGAVASLISEDVRKALSKFKDLQNSQAQYQQVTSKEKIYSVLSVQTQRHAQDPTTFLVDVVVQNAATGPIELSIVFAVPTVVALLGSNGLFLGPEAYALEQAQHLQIPLLPTR